MRTLAFAVAILTLAPLSTAHAADDDFATLLGELSFGDADPLANAAPRPLDNPNYSQTFAAAPQRPQNPQRPLTDPNSPAGFAAGPAVAASPAPAPSGVFNTAGTGQTTPEAYAQSPPPVSLTNPVEAPLTYPTPAPPITPASAPVRNATARVDLNAAFAVQEGRPVQAQAVRYSSKRYADCGYEAAYPRRATPDLPNSTLLQYFRSSKCHTNVWVGYHQKCCPSLRNITLPCTHLFKGGSCLDGCGCVVDRFPVCGCGQPAGQCGCDQRPPACGYEQQPNCGYGYTQQPDCGYPQQPNCGYGQPPRNGYGYGYGYGYSQQPTGCSDCGGY